LWIPRNFFIVERIRKLLPRPILGRRIFCPRDCDPCLNAEIKEAIHTLALVRTANR
jgi:hypothetical protein